MKKTLLLTIILALCFILSLGVMASTDINAKNFRDTLDGLD